MGWLRALAVLVLVALLPMSSHALGPLVAENEEIGIDAEQLSFDQKNNVIVASGHVVITRGAMTLRADEVRVNRSTNEAEATGNVSVTDPMGTIVADEMHFNLDEETGLLLDAEVKSQRLHYTLSGTRIEKDVGQNYHIENGRFTTCRCTDGPQSWSISGKDVDVSMGGYATLRSGTFNILDHPVLYLPRALLPIQRERQSGFLTPRFGVSNQRGFQTTLPYYWAIDKSQDTTLGLDVETSARIGLIDQYRYALSHDSSGVLNLSYYNEFFRGTTEGGTSGSTIPTNRWSILSSQTQQVWEGMRAYTDMFMVSDDLFLREINTYAFDLPHTAANRTLPFVASHAGFVQLWDRAVLRAEGTYYQNLSSFDPVTNQPVPGSLVGQTLQRAPVANLGAQKSVGPFLSDLNASAVDYQRGNGADGFRLDMQPGMSLALPLGNSFFGAVHASGRETAYHLTNTNLIGGGSVPRDDSRELVQVDGQVGTSLDRVYPVSFFGLEKLKHTIEPSVQYLYIPSVAQTDLAFFDGTDRVERRNLVTYGFTSRFIGRFLPEPDDSQPKDATHNKDDPASGLVRELGRFSITQSADITHEIDTLEPDRSVNHFSDMDIAARINPSRFFSLDSLTIYDPESNSVGSTRLGLFVEDPRDVHLEDQRLETRTSARVSYRVLTQNRLQEIDDAVVLRLTDLAGFLYSSRYDLVESRFLDNFFGLRLISACDCWALEVAVSDRTNPHEVEVRTQLTLVGLGSSRSNSRSAGQP